jgi:hypothetical protein
MEAKLKNYFGRNKSPKKGRGLPVVEMRHNTFQKRNKARDKLLQKQGEKTS